MPTQFQEIRDLIRAIVLDSDSQNFLYANEVIDQHIKLVVMVESDGTKFDDSVTPPIFLTTITPTNKALLAYRVSQGLISNNPDYFTYKSPVLTVGRAGGTIQLLAHIQKQIDRLQGGMLALQEDNELWAYLNGPARWSRDYSDRPAE